MNPHKQEYPKDQPTACQNGKGPTIHAILTKQPQYRQVFNEQPNNTAINYSTRNTATIKS